MGLVNVIMTGRGKGGAWAIRGEQLGQAIDATIDPVPKSFKGYDAGIVVKRPRAEVVERMHAAKLPVIWDVVDAWPQPDGNEWDRAACMAWIKHEIQAIRPAGIVAATDAMADDLMRFKLPTLALHHHARPKQDRNPLREEVRTVGYQGGDYLGGWRDAIERQCTRRGWQFVIDSDKAAPCSLADFDIVVAFREQRGYAARNWKSNVKLANAHGSGTPSVVQRDAGYVETAGSRQYFADNEEQLGQCLDTLASIERRREEVERYRPLKLGHIAERYSDWLYRVV